MPRRGGFRNNGGGHNINNKHYEHNETRNTSNRMDSRRRVSFKTAGAVSLRGKVRLRLEDEVMSVMDVGGSRREGSIARNKGRISRRRGSPVPKGGHGPPGKKKLIAGTSGWFQVTIPNGQKYDKQHTLKQLLTLVHPHILIPHYFKVDLTTITFFVDDINVAEILLNSDRQLSFPDGFKMLIRVRNSIPHTYIDDSLKIKMKMAMGKRYTAETKALDLTKFHADQNLQDIFCALLRPPIMLAAIEVIAENIPDLEALKLNDNKIHMLDHLKCLPTKLPYLKILHLANNKITSTNALDALKECQLVDLVLDGNPFKDRMQDESNYVSEIRKKFPKLLRLDGIELPPLIKFDITDDYQLPPSKASFLCNMSGAGIVRNFLEQYFIIFDSGSRQPLLDAYHEQAMFSMTAMYSQQPHLRLSSYLSHNRNLLRVRNLDARCKLQRNGRLPVVSFLTELPSTQHDPLSFAVDLTLFTPKLIMLTVSGVFKENPKSGSTNLRAFQKVMTIVPSGSGFCIKNEMMHISNGTMAQVKYALKPKVANESIVNCVNAASQIVTPDEENKQHMIELLKKHTNMNMEWSRKCLEETNWDFNIAGYTFNELQKQNKIPPEAFI